MPPRFPASTIAILFCVAGCGLDTAGGSEVGSNVLSGSDASLDATVRDGGAGVDAGDLADAGDTNDASDAIADVVSPLADADIPDAAPIDAVAPDAASDAGCILCNGACITAPDCATCAGAPLFCATTRSCMADCASCARPPTPPRPIECFRCDINRQNPVGSCEPQDPTVYCLNGSAYGATYHCACGDNVPCPGRSQVCTDIGVGSMVCATCGEAYSDNFDCVSGGKCNAAKASCK